MFDFAGGLANATTFIGNKLLTEVQKYSQSSFSTTQFSKWLGNRRLHLCEFIVVYKLKMSQSESSIKLLLKVFTV